MNIWTGEPAAKEPTEIPGPLNRKSIPDIQALDTQLGIQDKVPAPAALIPALFGDPDVRCYAILDGAKITALDVLLESSGLEYRPLFLGEAQEEIGDQAPFIVALDPENPFTANLFTDSPASWHLWGVDWGILIQSRATLDQVWNHVRKFTRIKDVNGKWFFFRFWQGIYLEAVLTHCNTGRRSGFFERVDGFGFLHRDVNQNVNFRQVAGQGVDGPVRSFVLDDEMSGILKQVRFYERACQAALDLDIPAAEREDFVPMCQRHYSLGYENDRKIRISHELFQQVPASEHDNIWQVISRGDHTLGVIHAKMKDYYKILDRS